MITWHGRLALGLGCWLLICVSCTLAYPALLWACDMVDHNDGCLSAVLVMLAMIVVVCEGLRRHWEQ